MTAAVQPSTHAAETATQTRERLLDAAERLFAERGYHAASVREITARAHCNVAAVNYHFGSKLNLYTAVFHRRLAALREQRIARVRTTLDRAGDRATLELVLTSFAQAFLEPLVRGSEGRMLMMLMGRELLDAQLPPGFFRREMIVPVRAALEQAFGRVAPGLDPDAASSCAQSFVAQLSHLVSMQRYQGEDGGGPADTRPLDAALEHIVRFTAAGIRAYSEGSTT